VAGADGGKPRGGDCRLARRAPREAGRGERQPAWATPHRVRLELGTMQLRDFSTGAGGIATLICAPFALHGATIADFARGHSVVEALHEGGVGRIDVTDWRSAGPQMRFLSIDNYLADLNVAVDELGPPVDLVGLCQGGWMALTFAARFPSKVRRLVLAGAPVDIAAGQSNLSRMTLQVPLAAFEEFVASQDGRVLGERVLQIWGTALIADDAGRVLQLPPGDDSPRVQDMRARFDEWYDLTVDLPGAYYLQVVSWLFKENRLATGKFVALGRRIDLSAVRHPIFLLGAAADEIVAPEQLIAKANRVGTPRQHIEAATEPCGHLSLFLGAETMKRGWPRIAALARRGAIGRRQRSGVGLCASCAGFTLRLDSEEIMQKSDGKKKQKCKNCEGKGTLKKGDKVVRCQRCDGTGIKR
jgi:poly(3-hydroxyalkanoate) synthetase